MNIGHLHFHGEPDDHVVAVSCLKHIYPDTTEIHICGLDFMVKRGERVVVLGGNGSGKTTLIYHILGLLKPDEGKVSVFNVNPATDYDDIREKIGVLLQNVEEQILSPTVWEDIAFSPRNYGYGKEETAKMVEDVMQELGIVHLRDRICHYLSGGEKRKVALAGALVMRPELLVLDEPFEGLDTRSRNELVAILNRRNSEGMSIIMSTHDLNLVGGFADRVYVLARGEGVVTAGTPFDILTQTEALQRSNIDPPVLTELFARLRDSGVTVEIPISVDQAVKDLGRMLKP
ncbi:MAG: energy-coupling factor ABC transporter ATP-binding protein [Nitrospirota bacterium]|nr:energy-coupling factor ABC transporter ATP-binding protein [Nitrospirota bacterium]